MSSLFLFVRLAPDVWLFASEAFGELLELFLLGVVQCVVFLLALTFVLPLPVTFLRYRPLRFLGLHLEIPKAATGHLVLPPFGLEGDTLGDPSFKGGVVVVEGLALVADDASLVVARRSAHGRPRRRIRAILHGHEADGVRGERHGAVLNEPRSIDTPYRRESRHCRDIQSEKIVTTHH